MVALPTAQGAYLSSSTSGTSTIAQISLTSADSAYPGTLLSGGGVKLIVGGPISIAGRVRLNNVDNVTAYIYRNGSQLFAGSVGSQVGTVSGIYVASPQDVYTLWASDPAGDIYTTGSTNTYLHIVPLGVGQIAGLATAVRRAGFY